MHFCWLNWKITKYSKGYIPIERKCKKCGKVEINVWGHWSAK